MHLDLFACMILRLAHRWRHSAVLHLRLHHKHVMFLCHYRLLAGIKYIFDLRKRSLAYKLMLLAS